MRIDAAEKKLEARKPRHRHKLRRSTNRRKAMKRVDYAPVTTNTDDAPTPVSDRSPVKIVEHTANELQSTAPHKRVVLDGSPNNTDEEPDAKRRKIADDRQVTSFIEDFRCVVCQVFVRPPASSCDRGCLMCPSCINAYLAGQTPKDGYGAILCPACRLPFEPRHEQKSVDKILKDVPVTCAFSCGVTGLTVSTIDAHESVCSHATSTCVYSIRGCPWYGRRNDMKQHRLRCPFRIYDKAKRLFVAGETKWTEALEVLRERLESIANTVGIFSQAVGVGAKSRLEFAPLHERASGSWEAVWPVEDMTVGIVIEEITAEGDAAVANSMETRRTLGYAMSIRRSGRDALVGTIVEATITFKDSNAGNVIAVGTVATTFTVEKPFVRVHLFGAVSYPANSQVAIFFAKFEEGLAVDIKKTAR